MKKLIRKQRSFIIKDHGLFTSTRKMPPLFVYHDIVHYYYSQPLRSSSHMLVHMLNGATISFLLNIHMRLPCRANNYYYIQSTISKMWPFTIWFVLFIHLAPFLSSLIFAINFGLLTFRMCLMGVCFKCAPHRFCSSMKTILGIH